MFASVQGVDVDIPGVMKVKQKRVDGLTSGVEMLFKKYGVKYVKGTGSISAPDEVTVQELGTNTTKKIRTKNIVIATGSEVTPVPGINVRLINVFSGTLLKNGKTKQQHLSLQKKKNFRLMKRESFHLLEL